MRPFAALSLLVLALAATGGEARAGDGVSARQLLTKPKPVGCKDSKCDKVLTPHCEWLPKADIKCDNKDKYKVAVKNCFKNKIDYIFISVDGKCTKYYKTYGDVIAKLDLKCGDKITIFGTNKYFKGNTDKACGDDSSSRVAGGYCKTCKFEAEFKCPKDLPKPGDKCRDAKYACDKDAVLDNYCKCPEKNPLHDSKYMCHKRMGKCDKDAFCDGYSAECPLKFASNTTVCRRSYGECDMPEYCTGKSADCPMDMYKPNTTECRAAYLPCDEPEFCTGKSAKCPKDMFKTADKKCGDAKGVCDLDDYCSGYSPKCKDKVVEKGKKVCRPAVGPCDAPEYCDGESKDCGKDYCVDHRKELTKDHPYWHGGRD